MKQLAVCGNMRAPRTIQYNIEHRAEKVFGIFCAYKSLISMTAVYVRSKESKGKMDAEGREKAAMVTFYKH